jgi:hypothetical protein
VQAEKLFDNQAVSLHLRSRQSPDYVSIGLKVDNTDKRDNHAYHDNHTC